MSYLDHYRPGNYCPTTGTCDVCAEDGACREYIEEIANDANVPVEFAAFYCLDHEADREAVEDAWNKLADKEKWWLLEKKGMDVDARGALSITDLEEGWGVVSFEVDVPFPEAEVDEVSACFDKGRLVVEILFGFRGTAEHRNECLTDWERNRGNNVCS